MKKEQTNTIIWAVVALVVGVLIGYLVSPSVGGQATKSIAAKKSLPIFYDESGNVIEAITLDRYNKMESLLNFSINEIYDDDLADLKDHAHGGTPTCVCVGSGGWYNHSVCSATGGSCPSGTKCGYSGPIDNGDGTVSFVVNNATCKSGWVNGSTFSYYVNGPKPKS